ncbi:serine/threonine-protein kinase [Actinotalea sp. K2]|uniref:serine/threonine-protein kinase n=1 Tax=Actinotalea sp. K2 TaxID=2939438 RepID=UPI002017DE9E|nr:serine/threonine-protein kinase [Actinotalea sp. K2]MCL3860783.1 protein kinase [Actinotalea sp. K2]
MKPLTGIALGGRYRLVSRIAVGGMGEVWVGHDEALARDVAVKVLREEFAGDAGFLERFRAEARNSAHLSHPNIAQLYDYGEQEGSGFLVMELVLGEPMSDLLDRQPVLPTRRLLPILAQTARALHAAHVGGVVHRDVKPGNILLARSGRVKITDFGISTATNQVPMTASGMVMGTAQYLSPEQAIGRAATPASDIYSLGIVAYEALVGNRPFTGPTAVDIAVAHVNTPVPPLPGDVDAELAELVMRMLAKEPEERPRSAASLARTMDAMVERTPPGGLPLGAGRHARTIDVMDTVESYESIDDDGWSRATGTIPNTGMVPAVVLPSPPPGREAQPLPGVHEPTRQQRVTTAPPPTTVPPHPSSTDGASTADQAAADQADEPPPHTAGTAARLAGLSVPVPGRPEDQAAPLASDAPAFPPGVAPTRARGASRSTARTTARSLPRVLRTSTTTGRRMGHLTAPLVALVLMVIFALLGAAFADRIFGPSRAAPGTPGSDGGYQIVMVTSAGPERTSGMIGERPDPIRNENTQTARDQ